jgi:hypothetical protein
MTEPVQVAELLPRVLQADDLEHPDGLPAQHGTAHGSRRALPPDPA